VLLTRSPLVYPRRGLTVRLACVKHAASVRPEPGSNSPLKNIANPTKSRTQRQKQRVQPLTEPITGSIINQSQRNPHPTPPTTPKRATSRTRHEVSHSAYLALTLSTLLSSQDSLTHRTRTFIPAWGNSVNTTRVRSSFQIGLRDPPCWRDSGLRTSVTLERDTRSGLLRPVGYLRVGRRIRRSSRRSRCPAPREGLDYVTRRSQRGQLRPTWAPSHTVGGRTGPLRTTGRGSPHPPSACPAGRPRNGRAADRPP
jgi:hypothetical protein